MLLFLFTIICCITSFSYRQGKKDIPKIKTETNFLKNTVTTYEYYTDGTIQSEYDSAGNTLLYDYYKDRVVRTRKGSYFKKDTLIFWLNESGLLVSHKETCPPGTPQFEYDAEGHYIRMNTYTGLKHVRNYEDGNMISEMDLDKNGKVIRYNGIEYRIYYTDKINCINPENNGQSFMGVFSRNLPSKDFYVNENDDTVRVKLFRYEFDSKDRVKLKVVTNVRGKLLDSIAYTYY